MNFRKIILLFVFFCLTSIAGPIDASMVNLIATPEKFEAKLVRFVGFVHLEFEGNAIYLHKDDYIQGAKKNGLWLEMGKHELKKWASLSGRYVIVEGVFSERNKGHLGLWSGSLDKITRIESLSRI